MSTRSNSKKKPVSKKKPAQPKSILATLTHKYKSSDVFEATQYEGKSLYELMIDDIQSAVETSNTAFCKRIVDDYFQCDIDEAMNKLNAEGFFSFCYGDYLVVGLNPAETYNWTREL